MEQKISLGKLIGNGKTAEVFELNTTKAVKLFHPGISIQSVEREFEIGQAVKAKGVSAPEMYEIVDVKGRLGIVMARAPGVAMLTQMSENPLTLFRCANKLAQVHIDLNSHHGAGLPSQFEMLEEKISMAQQLPFSKKEVVLKLLRSLPEGEQLCHGDFHTDNVLFDEHQAMTIDWVDASYGSQFADLAKASLLIKLGSLSEKTPFWLKQLTQLFRRLFHDHYISKYINGSEENIQLLKDWQTPIAAARLADNMKTELAPLLRLIDEGLNAR
jgi:uncharacterized protein (TIGR02172 family)